MEKQVVVINKREKLDIDFDKIAWTVKVRSKDPTRFAIQRIYADKGNIIATDGHRLHLARIDRNIEDGLYMVSTANAKMIVLEPDKDGYTFPAYERVIPSNEVPEKMQVLHNKNGNKTDMMRMIYQLGKYEVDYLSDAYMPETTCKVKHYGGMRPLLITEESRIDGTDTMQIERLAVVMPIRED